ncbi:MAG: TetR/AcrR family transcriptional regulator [Duganella sp.]
MHSAQRETYHHGDLRPALVRAARELLIEKGLEYFSLRAVARRVGVSPAAPAYHFGDAAGLLTEVAIGGFEELNRCMAERAAVGAQAPVERLHAFGQAYIRFAFANPPLFHLMFRKDKLRITDALKASAIAAFSHLQAAVCEAAGVSEQCIGPDLLASMLAAWSMVHGFAHLALDGQFERFAVPNTLDSFCEIYIPLAIQQLRFSEPKQVN